MIGLRRVITVGVLAACVGGVWAQAPAKKRAPLPAGVAAELDQPDAQNTRDELQRLLERYPPSLRNLLATDPALLNNEAYLAPYPVLAEYLKGHPDVSRNPSFYLGEGLTPRRPVDRESQVLDMYRDVMAGVGVFLAIGLAVGLLVWLIRTLIDYRRWARLAKVQAEVHTKLLDRFTANEDLLAYIQSPAGAGFLQSSPIKLDGGRAIAAPLARILWSLQGGIVLMAGGVGLRVVGGQVGGDVAQPLRVLGVVALSLGAGFILSAAAAYFLSRRLGLVEGPQPAVNPEQ